MRIGLHPVPALLLNTCARSRFRPSAVWTVRKSTWAAPAPSNLHARSTSKPFFPSSCQSSWSSLPFSTTSTTMLSWFEKLFGFKEEGSTKDVQEKFEMEVSAIPEGSLRAHTPHFKLIIYLYSSPFSYIFIIQSPLKNSHGLYVYFGILFQPIA